MSGEKRKQPPHDGPHVVLILEGKESKAAATGAAMAHVLARPDSIRQRAQSAATISSAAAAVLVIAALSRVAGVGDASFRFPTVVLVGLAVLTWAVSVGLFIFAVAFVARVDEPGADYQELVRAYERYADRVRQRMRRAAIWSGVALVLAVLAVGEVVADGLRPQDAPKRLLLSGDGAVAAVAVCRFREVTTRLRYVDGELTADALGKPFVEIHDVVGVFAPRRGRRSMPRRNCQKTQILRLPRRTVRAVFEQPDR